MIMKLGVTWPSELNDVRTLHTVWLVLEGEKRVSEHHTNLGGFSQRCEKCGENGVAWCTRLPTSCSLFLYNLQWRCGLCFGPKQVHILYMWAWILRRIVMQMVHLPKYFEAWVQYCPVINMYPWAPLQRSLPWNRTSNLRKHRSCSIWYVRYV